MPGPVVAAVGGSLISGISQSRAAKTAARAQTDAANRDIAFQTETRDLIRNDLRPWLQGGTLAQQAYDYELGLASRPMVGGTPMAIETVMPGIPATGGQTVGQFPGTGGQTVGQAPGVQPAQPTLSTGQRMSRMMDSFGRADRGGTGAANGAANSGGGSIDSRPAAPVAAAAPMQAAAPMYRVGGQTFSTMEEAQAYANANAQGGTPYQGYTKTPGYDFRLQQGQDSLEAGAAARGGLYSGAAMRDLLKFGQDYGSAEYGNYMQRLAGRADTGMNAATMSGQASQAAAGAVGNAFANIGNAQSAGAIGRANALSGGISNIVGAWNYQRNLNNAGGGAPAPWFGGGR